MSTTQTFASGATLVWYGDDLQAGIRRDMVARLQAAGRYLVARARKNLSTGQAPSKPGQYPAARSGALAGSVYYDVDETDLSLTVGSTSPYVLFQEFGRAGGKTIYARPGSVFAWKDDKTGDVVYARKITLGPIAPRPIFRRLLYEEAAELTRILCDQGSNFGPAPGSEYTPGSFVPMGVAPGTP